MSSIYLVNSALNTAIADAARQYGNGKAFSRRSTLDPKTMLRLLIGADGGTLDKILHTAGIQATASAVSQRRAQIPTDVFRSVFNNFNARCTDIDFFRCYRLIAVDGTTVSLPRNPASPSFVRNDSIPNGVNQLHVKDEDAEKRSNI